jgi:hypothetical protein
MWMSYLGEAKAVLVSIGRFDENENAKGQNDHLNLRRPDRGGIR